MQDFIKWWEETVHGNYITNKQFDRIVAQYYL